MTRKRYDEIFQAVIVNQFYDVGEDGTISHEEMMELIRMAGASYDKP